VILVNAVPKTIALDTRIPLLGRRRAEAFFALFRPKASICCVSAALAKYLACLFDIQP
jgi:hypothetical protein